MGHWSRGRSFGCPAWITTGCGAGAIATTSRGERTCSVSAGCTTSFAQGADWPSPTATRNPCGLLPRPR
eukprot:1804726-Alexandrium_andersonii.AAC.1